MNHESTNHEPDAAHEPRAQIRSTNQEPISEMQFVSGSDAARHRLRCAGGLAWWLLSIHVGRLGRLLE